MFAVLKTGGKQYKVASGDTLRVEKLAAEAGEAIQFNDVLMVDGEVGAPFVAGAAVQATVIDQVKGDKTIHFVRRRRKHSSKRTKGHRQQLTLIRVTDILASGGEATGVKAAVGAAFRPVASALPTAVGVVATAASAAARAGEAVADVVTESAAATAPTVRSVRKRAESAAVKVADVVTDAAKDVTEAVEDVAGSRAGAVALAVGAAAGVAALAAAVLLPGAAQAEDAAAGGPGDTATDADSKE